MGRLLARSSTGSGHCLGLGAGGGGNDARGRLTRKMEETWPASLLPQPHLKCRGEMASLVSESVTITLSLLFGDVSRSHFSGLAMSRVNQGKRWADAVNLNSETDTGRG